MCQISSGSVYSVALCWRKSPIFAGFWTSAFSGVANWQQSEKVGQGCTTTNLPLSTASKSFLYSNAFMAKSGAQSLTFKNVHDEQTDRQTLNVFGHPGGGLQPSPTKLGRVIEDLFLFRMNSAVTTYNNFDYRWSYEIPMIIHCESKKGCHPIHGYNFVNS